LTPATLKFFDEAVTEYNQPKIVSNWIMGELNRLLNVNNMEIEDSRLVPGEMVKLLKLIDAGTISGKIAKTVFEEMFSTGKEPEQIIKEKGLVQISDEDTLKAMIDDIVAANPKVVEDYKNGKEKAFGFFVGQLMKATRGQANPAIVNKLLQERLSRE
jgi:aspartyl-tRNA(Asn)/glutamyl-tRNA(Gln) amidotransferase subunit B